MELMWVNNERLHFWVNFIFKWVQIGFGYTWHLSNYLKTTYQLQNSDQWVSTGLKSLKHEGCFFDFVKIVNLSNLSNLSTVVHQVWQGKLIKKIISNLGIWQVTTWWWFKRKVHPKKTMLCSVEHKRICF